MASILQHSTRCPFIASDFSLDSTGGGGGIYDYKTILQFHQKRKRLKFGFWTFVQKFAHSVNFLERFRSIHLLVSIVKSIISRILENNRFNRIPNYKLVYFNLSSPPLVNDVYWRKRASREGRKKKKARILTI